MLLYWGQRFKDCVPVEKEVFEFIIEFSCLWMQNQSKKQNNNDNKTNDKICITKLSYTRV